MTTDRPGARPHLHSHSLTVIFGTRDHPLYGRSKTRPMGACRCRVFVVNTSRSEVARWVHPHPTPSEQRLGGEGSLCWKFGSGGAVHPPPPSGSCGGPGTNQPPAWRADRRAAPMGDGPSGRDFTPLSLDGLPARPRRRSRSRFRHPRGAASGPANPPTHPTVNGRAEAPPEALAVHHSCATRLSAGAPGARAQENIP